MSLICNYDIHCKRHGFESKMEWILRDVDSEWGIKKPNFRLWSATAITEKDKIKNSKRKDGTLLVRRMKRK